MKKPPGESHFVRQLRAMARPPQRPAVLETLRDAIISGEVRAGSVIWVEEVAQAFGVSAIPVREGLKTLVAEGLVEHLPRGGYAISWLSVQEYTELYVVCRSLELAVIPAAIARADADDDARVCAAFTASEIALDTHDPLGYQSATKAFHRSLVSPAQMSRVLAILDTTWNMTEPGQPMTQLSRDLRWSMHAEHAGQRDAFLRRDTAALLRLTEEHYASLLTGIASLPGRDDVFRAR